MNEQSEKSTPTIAEVLIVAIAIAMIFYFTNYSNTQRSQKNQRIYVESYLEEALITSCHALGSIPERSEKSVIEKTVNKALAENSTLRVPNSESSESDWGQLKYRQFPPIEGRETFGFNFETTPKTPDWFRVAIQNRVSLYGAVNTQTRIEAVKTCGEVISRAKSEQCTGMFCF